MESGYVLALSSKIKNENGEANNLPLPQCPLKRPQVWPSPLPTIQQLLQRRQRVAPTRSHQRDSSARGRQRQRPTAATTASVLRFYHRRPSRRPPSAKGTPTHREEVPRKMQTQLNNKDQNQHAQLLPANSLRSPHQSHQPK